MKAVILAAGRGSRLKPFTDTLPKSLLPLGTTTLVHRTVGILRDLGVDDVTIVIGYMKHKFRDAFPEGVRFETNEYYDRTDQAASLLEASKAFDDDVLVVTGDLFCTPRVFADIIDAPSPVCVAVDRTQKPFDDTIEKVRFEDERIVRIGKVNVGNAEANGEFLGMTMFRREECGDALLRIQRAVGHNSRSALIHVHQDFIDQGRELGYVEVCDEWCEVDDLESMEKARRLLSGTA